MEKGFQVTKLLHVEVTAGDLMGAMDGIGRSGIAALAFHFTHPFNRMRDLYDLRKPDRVAVIRYLIERLRVFLVQEGEEVEVFVDPSGTQMGWVKLDRSNLPEGEAIVCTKDGHLHMGGFSSERRGRSNGFYCPILRDDIALSQITHYILMCNIPRPNMDWMKKE